MLIKDWMSKSVVTIEPEASLDQAADLFRTRVISMLPVLAGEKLVGVLTDGDIKRALPSNATTLDRYELNDLMGQVRINTIMSSPVTTIDWDQSMDQAARLMLSSGISGLPVMEYHSLAGIITKSDVFRCLVSFAGGAKSGQNFGFKLQDTPGLVKIISDSIRSCGGHLSSILTSYDNIEPGFRKVFFHTYGIDPEEFEPLVAKLHRAGELIYAADLSRGLKRVF